VGKTGYQFFWHAHVVNCIPILQRYKKRNFIHTQAKVKKMQPGCKNDTVFLSAEELLSL
jgi:hypothetical protein